MSAETVSLCRFLYGIPLVLLGYIVSRHFWKYRNSFLRYFCVRSSFVCHTNGGEHLAGCSLSSKNFAVAVIYTKTEAIFTALLAFVLLFQNFLLCGMDWHLHYFSRTPLTSLQRKHWIFRSEKSFNTKAHYQGIASGFFFGISAAFVKYSFTFLEGNSSITKAVLPYWWRLLYVFLLLPCILETKMELLRFCKTKNTNAHWHLFRAWSFCGFFFHDIRGVCQNSGQIEFSLLGFSVSIVFKRKNLYEWNTLVWLLWRWEQHCFCLHKNLQKIELIIFYCFL